MTVDGQASNNLPFHIGDRTPTVTSINPSELGAGESATVTITGTNFGTNPEVQVDCCEVNISQTTTNAAGTQIQAVFSVGNSANAGVRQVTVVSHGISGMGFQSGTGETANSNSIGFEVKPLTVTFQQFQIVGKGASRNIAVTVIPANNSSPITLTLRRSNGSSGSAQFANNSNTMQITTSQNVEIKGITESDVKDNIILEADKGSAPPETFSVALIKINRDVLSYDSQNNVITTPTPVTDATPTTIVGERIMLNAEIVPPGITPTSQMWTIPETVVKDFVVSANKLSGGKVDLDGLNTPTANFVWVDGGGTTVNDFKTKQVDFTWKDNNYDIKVKATFHVKRPLYSPITVTSDTSILFNSSSLNEELTFATSAK